MWAMYEWIDPFALYQPLFIAPDWEQFRAEVPRAGHDDVRDRWASGGL